jgi:carbon monoxide dehydrogenase subunit G
MRLEQSFEVAAPLEQVWQTLIDVERVAPCLPGAAVTGRNDDGSYSGTFTVKIGPTTASYTGRLEMENVDEASHTATMQAQGTDKRGQGGAKATIYSRLAGADGAGTRVDVVTDYHITGRLARFGRGGMIEEISNRLLREFAKRLQSSIVSEADTFVPGEQPPVSVGDASPAAAEPPVPAESPVPAEPPAVAEPPAEAAWQGGEAEAQQRAAWQGGEPVEAQEPAPPVEEPPTEAQVPVPPVEEPPDEAPAAPAEEPPAEVAEEVPVIPVEESPADAPATPVIPVQEPPEETAPAQEEPVAEAPAPEPPPEPSPMPEPPPAPPTQFPEPSEPIQGLSLMGSVLWARVKQNPAPVVAGAAVVLLLARRRRRRRANRWG